MPPKRKQSAKSKSYSTRCAYPDCHRRYNEKGISYHQLPKNASQEQRENWIKVVPEVADAPHTRICSAHFRPEDFERDLRNEMLGLPLRNLLKPGSYPVSPNQLDKDVSAITEEQPATTSEITVPAELIVPNDDPISKQISREVDILTEIAELQMKLVEKLGKKADLDVHMDALSDCDNNVRISKENIVKSIKDEIYSKKPATSNLKINEANKDDIHLVTDLKNGKSLEFPGFAQDVRNFLNIKEDDANPLVVFDLPGHHEFKQSILTTNQRIKQLKGIESNLRESAKSNSEKIRRKMIIEGEKSLEKRKSEIETYKLKVVELKLWKRKWQTRQRSMELKKRKRKEKIDKRRAWINEQISKGFMHKSCKVLVHSRAKFPFEPGFDASRKRLKKSIPEDNLACLIRGVYVDKNGLVYPCKKKATREPKEVKGRKVDEVASEPLEASIIAETHHQIIEPVFTITDDGTLLHQQGVSEVHYIQEPFIEGVATLDENGAPTVIHYIQLDPSGRTSFTLNS